MKSLVKNSNGGGGALGFTLAEVLITLGIIGVVAAMTIPSLVSKYQMKTFEVALKKQISVLQNNINYLVMQEGLTNCYCKEVYNEEVNSIVYASQTEDCAQIKDNLMRMMKLTKISKDVTYPKKEDVLLKGGSTKVSSVLYDNVINSMSAYMLPDGAVFYMPNSITITNLAIDVNGQKGPNRWGYDMFFLDLEKFNDLIKVGDKYYNLKEKGGLYASEILINKESDKN